MASEEMFVKLFELKTLFKKENPSKCDMVIRGQESKCNEKIK